MANTPNPIALFEEQNADFVIRNKESGWADLDARDRAFCFHYIAEYDHRAAAEKVGYSPDRGRVLLRKPLNAAFIEYLQDQSVIPSLITKDYLDTQYMRLYEIAMGEAPAPRMDSMGGTVDAAVFNGDLAFKIIQEISKLNGHTPTPGAKIRLGMGTLSEDGKTAVQVFADVIIEGG